MLFVSAASTTNLDLLLSAADDCAFLNEILSSPHTSEQSTGFGPLWEEVFGTKSGDTGQMTDSFPQWEAVFDGGNDDDGGQKTAAQDSASAFLPSQLLDQFMALQMVPGMLWCPLRSH
jgi:hypothetical protein